MASHSLFEIVVLLAAVVIYFLPAMIADRRARHDLLTIALFNAVIGWTVLGWLLALYWALQPNPPKDLSGNVKARSRRVGMLLFSRRLDDRVQARGARRDTDTDTTPGNAPSGESRNADRERSSH